MEEVARRLISAASANVLHPRSREDPTAPPQQPRLFVQSGQLRIEGSNREHTLIGEGVLDSRATVKLVAFLEEHYRATIGSHEASVAYQRFADRGSDPRQTTVISGGA